MNSTRPDSIATALAAAHHALLANIDRLEQLIEPLAGAHPGELCDCLGMLLSRLEAHFRFEEHNGYMDAVLARAPQLARQVEGLRAEHVAMRQSLAALAGESRTAPAVNDALRQKVREWVGRVRDHETRENLLVEDAFNQDMAAED
jgi:hypothetical protein